MAFERDSMQNILLVALSVCLACSIVVSATAVLLKPQQIANREADRYKNILVAAGLYEEGETSSGDIEALFDRFEVRLVDLEEKRFLSESEIESRGIDMANYDQRKASKDPSLSKELSSAEDIASISRRARYAVAYLLRDGDELQKIVLPIHGYGLWSTMYGFIALEGDLDTVAGITFYEQQETAGLGGEVENPAWKAGWEGKDIYDDDHDVALRVIKGTVDPNAPNAKHQIDGLSGATLTSRGVDNLIHYWLGEDGFGPLLADMKSRTTGAI